MKIEQLIGKIEGIKHDFGGNRWMKQAARERRVISSNDLPHH